MKIIKEFSAVLQPYGYNIQHCVNAIQTLSQQIEKDSVQHHGMLDRIPLIHSMIKDRQEKRNHEQKEQWKQVFQASYPYIRDDSGKELHHNLFIKAVELSKADLTNSKDGWYHLPKAIGDIAIPKEERKEFEELCKQKGKYLSFAIGKELEQQFLAAYQAGDHIWIHRTGLSQESSLLADIAKNGLIVPAQGHGENEKHELSYTATQLHKNHFPFLVQTILFDKYKDCQGVILCRTGQEPICENGRLHPSQIIGFAARDNQGMVNRLWSREEMEEIRDQKTILKNGTEISVNRKSQMELQAEDYHKIQLPNTGKNIILLTDTYELKPEQISVIYNGIIYGNLEMAARDIPLTTQETATLNDFSKQLCNQIQELNYDYQENEFSVSPLDHEGHLIKAEEYEYDQRAVESGEVIKEVEAERE